MSTQNLWTNQAGVSTSGVSTTSIVTLADGITQMMAFISVIAGNSLRLSMQIAPTTSGPWINIGSSIALSTGQIGSIAGQASGAGFLRIAVAGGTSSNVSIWLSTEIIASSGGGGIATSVAVTSMPSLPSGSSAIGTVGVTSLPSLPAGSANIGTVGIANLPVLPTGSNTIGNVGITTLPAIPSGSNTIGTVNLGTFPVALRPPTIRSRVTISLASALTNSPISLTGYSVVQNFFIVALTGTANISINGTANPVPAALHDNISNMNITSMYITTSGSVGGTITIELQGN